MKTILTTAALFALGASSPAELIELQKEDVVAFVGGTDLVRLQKAGRFEAALTERYKAVSPRFRDMAWDGDTVYFQSTVRERWRKEAFGSWNDQLKRVGATVVVAQFGKIESLEGEAGLSRFSEAYKSLLDELGAEGRRLAILEPFPLVWKNADASQFSAYVGIARGLAKQRGVPFITRAEVEKLAAGADLELLAAVREKHRLWYDYWRPANWKCLFGDDSRRVFSNAAEGLPSFKQEWETFPALIRAAEENVAAGKAVPPKTAPQRSGSNDADIAKELEAFEVLDGYEVSLFADERQGIANPLSVRWDAAGRMFVACSDVYPQIEPGVMPNDKIIMLQDTDGDGAADKSRVFAEGLSIPTGMEVGGDGVYVGHNTELVHFDWNGNRRLLLSGFGNGDSHQTSNGFAWSPDGELWFCQGDGIESRVETPFGVSSLFQAGVYRLRPGSLRLDPLLDDFMGPGNPWGVAFDDFGQSFVIDGAGGISYLTPASVPVHRRLRLPRIGNPGGYCGVDQLADGSFGLGDYKKNQVTRYRTPEDGGGFKVEFIAPLLRSGHRNFRPIDVKLGPDGATYVVDWYNPITCHQDDFYRHPARDKTHGRIWRVARKGGAAKPMDLTKASTDQLIAALRSDNRWIRTKSKQVLVEQGLKEVPESVREWEGRDLLEAVGLAVWAGLQDRPLLERLLASEDHRCRAYAARIAGRWNLHDLLELAAADPHPRVRMEAILAAGQIPEARSVLIAARAAESGRDRWIDYAFKQAVHHLRDHWIPAFKAGELDFSNTTRGLAAVLGEADSKALLDEARRMVSDGDNDREARVVLAKTLMAVGEEADMRFALEMKPPSSELLQLLAGRKQPSFLTIGHLGEILKSGEVAVRAAAWDLAKAWEMKELRQLALEDISAAEIGSDLHAAAIRAYGALAGKEAEPTLKALAGASNDPRAAALSTLMDADPEQTAAFTVRLMQTFRDPKWITNVFSAFVAHEGGDKRLARHLEGAEFDAAHARLLREQWIASGLVSTKLSEVLDKLAGVGSGRFEYGEGLIKELVAAASKGTAEKGQAHFRAAQMACAACHKVGDFGGVIGPDLSAVGSGVPPERIVTEVLWPTRQVKEGFSLSRLTKKDGAVLQGYIQGSREEERVLLRDFATGQLHDIPADEISGRDDIGSLMPPTAQSLSRSELADLLAYLFSLRG